MLAKWSSTGTSNTHGGSVTRKHAQTFKSCTGCNRTATQVHASLAREASSLAARTPAAKAAIFTGTYATIAGIALTVAPITVFGLLFDASAVPRGWIRVGGILFALIGMQYLGAGLNDGRLSSPAAALQPEQQQQQQLQQGSSRGSGSHVARQVGPYARSFYQASVWSRIFLACGFALLVGLKEAPLGLLILVALNLAGAASMLVAVRATDRALGASC